MTYTKLFSSITESTVWCESSDVRIVWITMLAMANWHGEVMGSIPGLAHRAQVSVEVAEQALAKFMAPDPYSRTKEYDGRRIEEIDGGWRLLNYIKHREAAEPIDREKRKEYMREYMREYRRPVKSVNTNSVYVNTDTDTDTDIDKEKTKHKSRAHFVRPTREEVEAYCQQRKNQINPDHFLNHYDAVGWKKGRTPITDWKACVRYWEGNGYGGQDGYHKSHAQLRSEQSDRNIDRAFAEIATAEDLPKPVRGKRS